jgi:hypothetical protein
VAKPAQPVKPAPAPAAKPAQPAPPAAAKPVQPAPAPAVTPLPAPKPAPAAKVEASPEPDAKAAPGSAAPMTKEEADKVRKEAAEMMAEAIRKNDQELMKKAIELQKSTIPHGGAQNNVSGAAAGFSISFLLGIIVVCLLILVSMWVVFEKCGEAGWKSLIPFYNMYVLMVICEKPVWWFLLLFIPGVGTVFYLLAMLALAERFGRGPLFGIGLTFLPMIFFPLLAFGGSKPEEFTFA